MKDTYNAGEPHADTAAYAAHFFRVLQGTGGYSPEDAARLTGDLLPDVLVLDRSVACQEPNRRRLDDDSIGNRIASMFSGRVPAPGIAAHTDLTSTFPYMGTPQPTPVPSGAA